MAAHQALGEHVNDDDPNAPAIDAEQVRGLRARVALATRFVGGFKRFLRRTHHKLLLADGCRFVMGGRNLADGYQRPDPPHGPAFADVDVMLTDSTGASPEYAAAFAALWHESVARDARDPDPTDLRAAGTLAELEAKARESDDVAVRAAGKADASTFGIALPDMDGRLVNNLPAAERGDESITRAYIDHINALAERAQPAVLDLTNAYLFLSGRRADSDALHDLRQALIDAAKAGVTVRLRTNSMATTDLRLVNTASYPGVSELLNAGIQIWELVEGQGSRRRRP